jgi:hypothetical protein
MELIGSGLLSSVEVPPSAHAPKNVHFPKHNVLIYLDTGKGSLCNWIESLKFESQLGIEVCSTEFCLSRKMQT